MLLCLGNLEAAWQALRSLHALICSHGAFGTAFGLNNERIVWSCRPRLVVGRALPLPVPVRIDQAQWEGFSFGEIVEQYVAAGQPVGSCDCAGACAARGQILGLRALRGDLVAAVVRGFRDTLHLFLDCTKGLMGNFVLYVAKDDAFHVKWNFVHSLKTRNVDRCRLGAPKLLQTSEDCGEVPSRRDEEQLHGRMGRFDDGGSAVTPAHDLINPEGNQELLVISQPHLNGVGDGLTWIFAVSLEGGEFLVVFRLGRGVQQGDLVLEILREALVALYFAARESLCGREDV